MCANESEHLGYNIANDQRDANLRLIGLLEAFSLLQELELPDHFYQGQMATPGNVKYFIRNELAKRINMLRPYPAIPL